MREVRMTFGEHLEELRKRLIAALLWLAVSTALCFIFGRTFLQITLGPHERAVTAAMRKSAFQRIAGSSQELEAIMGGASDAAPANWDSLFSDEIREQAARTQIAAHFDKAAVELAAAVPAASAPGTRRAVSELGNALSLSLMDLFSPAIRPVSGRGFAERFSLLRSDLESVIRRHQSSAVQEAMGLGVDFETIRKPLETFTRFLEERRRAVLEQPPSLQELRASLGSPELLQRVDAVFITLRAQVDQLVKDEPIKPKVLKYTEAFMTYFKVSLIFGILLALPLILYEGWKFVGAGLYTHEQKYVLIFFPFSLGLFLGGAFFGYRWMVPFGLEFLANWGTEFVDMNFTLESYTGLFFTLTIILGLVFQTPIVMLFLYKVEMVSPRGFIGARKYFLLCAVIFSTLVTPPDPISWSLMAGPIMCLYELGIRITLVLERRKRRAAANGANATA